MLAAWAEGNVYYADKEYNGLFRTAVRIVMLAAWRTAVRGIILAAWRTAVRGIMLAAWAGH